MRRTAATFVMVLIATGFVLADVRTDEKSQVKFEGTLGRMVNFFGGRGAREGIVSTVAVKGNRKMMTTDKTAQLVDLAEEKVYELDLDKKSYTVMTFAEIRRQMEEARRKAGAGAAGAAGAQGEGAGRGAVGPESTSRNRLRPEGERSEESHQRLRRAGSRHDGIGAREGEADRAERRDGALVQ